VRKGVNKNFFPYFIHNFVLFALKSDTGDVHTNLLCYWKSYGSSSPLCLCKLELDFICCLTQLSVGQIYINYYYIDNNYMFWRLIMAIFRLINENLVSSYTRLACIVYCVEVRGEVGTSSRMCFVGLIIY
jgi:hypothetical protein